MFLPACSLTWPGPDQREAVPRPRVKTTSGRWSRGGGGITLSTLLLEQEKSTGAEAVFRRVLRAAGADVNAMDHLAQALVPELPGVYLQKQDFERAERALARGLLALSRASIAAADPAYAGMLRERRPAKDAERVEGLSMGVR